MNDIVVIHGTEIAPLTYKNQRVVTLAMVDKVHQHGEGHARVNFTRNKKKFAENVDYTVVYADELRRGEAALQNVTHNGISPYTHKLTLLTERGYYKLATTFTDDLSWQIRDELIDGYFKGRELARTTHSVQLNSVRDLLSNPAALREALLGFTEKVIALENEVQELAPKGEFYDDMMKADRGQSIAEIAKVLGFGPRTFFKMLRDDDVMRDDNLPYQRYQEQGLFVVSERVAKLTHSNGEVEDRAYTKTLVTGKGLDWLRNKYVRQRHQFLLPISGRLQTRMFPPALGLLR